MEKFYTVKQVAEIMQASQGTIYRLCEGRQLAHIKIGTAIRISEIHLRDYMDAKTADVMVKPMARPKRRSAKVYLKHIGA